MIHHRLRHLRKKDKKLKWRKVGSDLDVEVQAVDPEYYNVLATHRSQIVSMRTEQALQFDKSILTLSGGALALSVALLDVEGKTTLWLISTWATYATAIAVTLTSFFASSQQLSSDVADIDRRMAGKPGVRKTGWNTAVKVLNVSSGLLFFLGTALFLIHVFSVKGLTLID